MSAVSDRIAQLEDAFPASVDGVFVATPALAQRLDLLRHLVEFSDLLLLLVGAPGAGKSALLAELLRSPGERWRVCEVVAPEGADADTLLALVLAGYGLRSGHHDSREQRMRLLESHLENQQRHGLVSLIVIDDAERLSADALAVASDLAMRFEGVRPRLLLAGARETLAPLAEPGSPSAPFTHLLELPPFSMAEAVTYVQARLRAAGLANDAFPEERLRARFAEQPILPGAINAAVREEAARIAPRKPARASSGGPRWLPVLLVVAAALGLTLLLYPAPDEDGEPADTAVSSVASSAAQTAAGTPADTTTTARLPAPGNTPSEAPADTAADDTEPATPSQAREASPSRVGVESIALTPRTEPTAGEQPPLGSEAGIEGGMASMEAEQLVEVADAATTTEAIADAVTAPTTSEGDAATPVTPIPDTAPALAVPPTAASLAKPTPIPVPALEAMPQPGSPAIPASASTTPTPEPAATPSPAPEPASTPAPTPAPASESTPSTSEAATTPPPAPEPASMPEPPPASTSASTPSTPGAATTPPAAPEPVSTPAPISASTPSTSEAATTPPPAPEPAASSEAVPAAAAAAGPAPPAGGTLAWLRAQPGGNFTIQLTGSSSHDAADRFVRKHRLRGRAVVVRTRRNGADWFIVVLGSYPDREAARAAINRLDRRLRRDSPWLRPIREVLSLAAR